ncbi:MAG: hypothetical protein RI953_1063 [Pseudomonadota bacterium]|jgi:hypothetical protein
MTRWLFESASSSWDSNTHYISAQSLYFPPGFVLQRMSFITISKKHTIAFGGVDVRLVSASVVS